LRNKSSSWLLLVILLFVVLITSYISAYQTEYANGWDGYYYLVQLQSYTSTGEMHSPEYSLVYLPLLAVYNITGDYMVSSKIAAIFIKLMFVFSVFVLSLKLLGSLHPTKPDKCFVTALLTATIASASPSLNFYFLQFPKNLMGFSFFFFFVASLVTTRKTISQRDKKAYIRIGISVVLFLAAFFTHRFTAVLSLIFLALFVLSLLKRRIHLLLKSKILWLSVSALAVVMIFSNNIPLAVNIYDIERITSDLNPKPIFVPIAFTEAFGVSKLTTAWIIEIYLAAALPIITFLLALWRRKVTLIRVNKSYYIIAIISLIGLFPFFEFSLTGLSYRLFFSTLLILPILYLPYIWLFTEKINSSFYNSSVSFRNSRSVILFFSILTISFFTGRSYKPEVHDPPYEFYEEVSQNAMIALEEVDFDLIIAHRSLAEFITYTYQVDALPWAPEERFERERVWRITAGIIPAEFSYYLSPEISEEYFVRLKGDYGLIREDYWEDFVEKTSNEPAMVEAINSWRNPMDLRPRFLAKNKES